MQAQLNVTFEYENRRKITHAVVFDGHSWTLSGCNLHITEGLQMRKLRYYVACTVDRFIAREDGSFDDFLTDGEHFSDLLESCPETLPAHAREALGVHAANKEFDVVLMGRRTYEVALKIGFTNSYPHLEQYVFSRSLNESPDPNVQLVTENSIKLVQHLKQQPGKDIWLCGGGVLATRLYDEIDELILKVNPLLLGSGIPLFSKGIPKTNLKLLSHKVYANDFMLLRYHPIH